MCFGGGGKPEIPKPPAPPSQLDASTAAKREGRERQRAASKSGRSSTILSGAVQDKSTTRKTLLGQ